MNIIDQLWPCTACTYLNQSTATRCEVCDKYRNNDNNTDEERKYHHGTLNGGIAQQIYPPLDPNELQNSHTLSFKNLAKHNHTNKNTDDAENINLSRTTWSDTCNKSLNPSIFDAKPNPSPKLNRYYYKTYKLLNHEQHKVSSLDRMKKLEILFNSIQNLDQDIQKCESQLRQLFTTSNHQNINRMNIKLTKQREARAELNKEYEQIVNMYRCDYQENNNQYSDDEDIDMKRSESQEQEFNSNSSNSSNSSNGPPPVKFETSSNNHHTQKSVPPSQQFPALPHHQIQAPNINMNNTYNAQGHITFHSHPQQPQATSLQQQPHSTSIASSTSCKSTISIPRQPTTPSYSSYGASHGQSHQVEHNRFDPPQMRQMQSSASSSRSSDIELNDNPYSSNSNYHTISTNNRRGRSRHRKYPTPPQRSLSSDNVKLLNELYDYTASRIPSESPSRRSSSSTRSLIANRDDGKNGRDKFNANNRSGFSFSDKKKKIKGKRVFQRESIHNQMNHKKREQAILSARRKHRELQIQSIKQEIKKPSNTEYEWSKLTTMGQLITIGILKWKIDPKSIIPSLPSAELIHKRQKMKDVTTFVDNVVMNGPTAKGSDNKPLSSWLLLTPPPNKAQNEIVFRKWQTDFMKIHNDIIDTANYKEECSRTYVVLQKTAILINIKRGNNKTSRENVSEIINYCKHNNIFYIEVGHRQHVDKLMQGMFDNVLKTRQATRLMIQNVDQQLKNQCDISLFESANLKNIDMPRIQQIKRILKHLEVYL